MTAYCPSAADFVIDYGDHVTLEDQGWTVHGNGRAATAAAYNMLGGSVEFDFDVSGAHRGVNVNIYTINPTIAGSKYHISDYCDGSLPDDGSVPWCPEVDWIESNGDCGGATTLHTKKQKGGNDGCTSWGCKKEYQYNGKTSFHVKVTYGTDGTWTTIRDGQVIDAGSLNPRPDGNAWAVVKHYYESKGAVIISSEWTGWVPVESCGGNANEAELQASHFSVRNLKITGSIVQGPTPKACGSDLETELITI